MGHGRTWSLAAGDGEEDSIKNGYRGVAPASQLVIAGLSRAGNEAISNDDLLRGVEFMYERAAFEGKPVAVNLSLGGDFGPHDGSMLWEQTLASFVGEEHPGRVLIAAAGNSGSVAEVPVHQSVRVTPGTRVRVPVVTRGASNGGVQIWVTLRAGADLKVGLDGPDEEWIPPIVEGTQRGKPARYNAGVIAGGIAGGPVPPSSRGAIVLWSGLWPADLYVTLEGEGLADLCIQGTGDGDVAPGVLASGVREGRSTSPGRTRDLAVGCTVNAPMGEHRRRAGDPERARSIGAAASARRALAASRRGRDLLVLRRRTHRHGVPKPNLGARGRGDRRDEPSGAAARGNIFTTEACPPVRRDSARSIRAASDDDEHAVAGDVHVGAMVTGAAALLLQRDPTLTQAKVTSILQAGAHRFRREPLFEDQGGPGELDIAGAFDALEQMKTPVAYLPSVATSWITLGADYATADGSTPLTAILELRTADGEHRADVFDVARLSARVLLDGEPLPPPVLERRGPGLWAYTVAVPRGRGGARLTLGATFDGEDVVAPKSVPVATDAWTARYPSSATGGCSAAPSRAGAPRGVAAWAAAVALGVAGLRARRRTRRW